MGAVRLNFVDYFCLRVQSITVALQNNLLRLNICLFQENCSIKMCNLIIN